MHLQVFTASGNPSLKTGSSLTNTMYTYADMYYQYADILQVLPVR